MKRLSLVLLCLSAVLGYIGLADCTCCGLNGSSSCCNPDAIADSIVSNCQNACSSNCVKLTPATCNQLKTQLSSSLGAITNRIVDIYNSALNIDSYAVQCITYVDAIREELQSAKTLLQSGNDASSLIQQAISQFQLLSNRWSSVSFDANGNLSTLFVSNVVTSVTISQPRFVNPIHFVNLIQPLLYSALDAIERREENEIPTAIQSIDQSFTYLDQIHNSSETGDLDFLREGIATLEYQASLLIEDSISLNGVLDSFDCEPCGKGASSSGDGGIGDGGTQDMTPILAELQSLRERLDYWMNKFFELIKRYFQDYNSAADSPLSVVDFDSYSASKNWFERVEMLLFSMSKINEDMTDSVPDKPDGSDELEDFMSSSEQDSETQSQDLKSTFDSSLQEVTDALDSFYHSWDSFAIPFSNFDGQIILSNPGEIASWDFSVPTGTSSVLQTMRNIFEVFWYIVIAFFYYAAIYFLVKVSIRYVLWFIQFSSSTFGD